MEYDHDTEQEQQQWNVLQKEHIDSAEHPKKKESIEDVPVPFRLFWRLAGGSWIGGNRRGHDGIVLFFVVSVKEYGLHFFEL